MYQMMYMRSDVEWLSAYLTAGLVHALLLKGLQRAGNVIRAGCNAFAQSKGVLQTHVGRS